MEKPSTFIGGSEVKTGIKENLEWAEFRFREIGVDTSTPEYREAMAEVL